MGGLKLTDIKLFLTSIKACWVKRFISNEKNGYWKVFYENTLKTSGGTLIFECNPDSQDIIKLCKNQSFLKDILLSWFSVVNTSNLNESEVSKHIIWNNKDIKLLNNIIFWKRWHEKGINYIDQLFDFRTGLFYKFEDARQVINLDASDYL